MKTIIATILTLISLYGSGLYDYPYLVNSTHSDIESKMDKHLMYNDFDKIIRFEPVFFEPSTNEIKPESKEYLKNIIEQFKQYKDRDIVVTIIGYTDHVQTKTEKVNQSWWYPTYQNNLTEKSSQDIALGYAQNTAEELESAGIPKEVMII